MERRTIQRFEIIEVVGAGGMGTVLRARDPQLARDVAIKVLHEQVAQPPSELSTHHTLDLRGERAGGLLDEARAMAGLSHPNVLPIYEVGLDGDRVFLVMELVDGETLRSYLATQRDRADLVDKLAQAARGLAAAHERGIIHRDFKPENILIGRDGRARVCDFGIANLVTVTGTERIADARGTPKYMAPELLRGEPATPAADVYALCVTIEEALGDAIDGGRALDPRDRPTIDCVIAALEKRRRSRRGLAIAIGLAGIAAIATFVLVARDDEPACEDGEPWFADWQNAPPAADVFERRRTEILEARTAICRARAEGTATRAQADMRLACLARRAHEYGALAKLVTLRKSATKASLRELVAHVPPTIASCMELSALPPHGDIAPLYTRYHLDGEGKSSAERAELLLELERLARAAGDAELAARAVISRGVHLRNADKLDESNAQLQQGFAAATAIQSDHLAALALSERSVTVMLLNDAKTAQSLSAMAIELAKKPGVSIRTRLRALAFAGRAHKERGEYLAAVQKLDTAATLVRATDPPMLDLEGSIRVDRIDAMRFLEDRASEAVAAAKEHLEWYRTHFGEGGIDFGVANNLLADALVANGDRKAALPFRRAAATALAAHFSPTHSRILRQRNAVAAALLDLGEHSEAQKEFSDVLAIVENQPDARGLRAMVLQNTGIATFEVGDHDKGIELLARALEEHISERGKDHASTLDARLDLALLLVERGRFDEAERHITALEHGYRANPEPSDSRLATLRGNLGARLLLARGRTTEAEARARESLASLAELGAPEALRHQVLLALGDSLMAQRRFDQARTAFVESASIAKKHLPADLVATSDAALAQAERALGNADSAKKLADGARVVLERFPGRISARKRYGGRL